MPGWQAQFEPLLKARKIRIVGIVQEQHAERARLYAQWRKIEWPILVDSLNLYGNSAVPIVQFVDEAGRIVRQELAEFLAAKSAEPVERKATSLPLGAREYLAGDFEGARGQLVKSIAGPDWFRQGVVYRARADSKQRKLGDAQRAVEMWQIALRRNPNQYIWRRRIEQYGPRLAKPYNFYGWIKQAREEIRKRGEEPLPLSVEPQGAELMDRNQVPASKLPDLDPDGKIDRDPGKLVELECFAAPWTVQPGKRVRVRVNLRPAAADWNDEGQALSATLKGEGFRVVEGRMTSTGGGAGLRTLECEVEIPADAKPGELKISGYALYDVCIKADGTCVFRRQDFVVTVQVAR